jgi:tripartite ATP-independent transporter DctM subunit
MEWTTILLITVGILLVVLASGMRIFLGLTLVGLIIIWIGMGFGKEISLGYSIWNEVLSFPMAAIPLFVLMGDVIFECGISHKAYNAVAPSFSHIPGGILHTNIVVGAIFAAATGSSMASTATIGTIALPAMESREYDQGIAMGSVAAGGSLGILIPPSITFIVYGTMTQQSIGRLFIAGILPGILLAVMYMVYIGLRVGLQPQLAPKGNEASIPWSQAIPKLLNIWPIVLLAVAVLGSIYAGIATPTESAAVGALGAVVLAAAYRSLSWKVLRKALISAAKTTCYIMLILAGAGAMGDLLANLGVFHEMSRWVVSLAIPRVGILFVILFMYVILGMFMSGLPSIIITLPVIFPIISSLGYDPIWFGVICVMVNEQGMLSPPVGLSLFILQGLRPKVPFRTIAYGTLPFFFVILACMGIMILFPSIGTWLPNLMIGGH